MTDKALLVGINAYPGAPLAGCINDVKDMANYLVGTMGFRPNAVRLLTDKRATTAAILSRLAWLVKDAKPGDRLFFHFSGHGTQVVDRNGDELDGMDEVICPVDFDWDSRHLISDDTFKTIFSSIPKGVAFVWISDSCHSGTLTRDFFSIPPKVKKSKAKVLGNRYMVPSVDHAWRQHAVADLAKTNDKLIRPIAATSLNVAFISGCKDAQTSADAEFSGRPNGALTYYLLKSLVTLGKDKPVSAVVQATCAALQKAGYSQIPQVDGMLAERPFLA